jgi:hypothetical protein
VMAEENSDEKPHEQVGSLDESVDEGSRGEQSQQDAPRREEERENISDRIHRLEPPDEWDKSPI